MLQTNDYEICFADVWKWVQLVCEAPSAMEEEEDGKARTKVNMVR